MDMNTRSAKSGDQHHEQPAPLVRRFAAKIAEASAGLPILDVACGSGRNAVLLVQLGCCVICIDRDMSRLREQQHLASRVLPELASPQLIPRQMDLLKDEWPFGESTIGGIINFHFFSAGLLPAFERSLAPGAHLLLETVPGCGGNYLELPRAGTVRSFFGERFELEFYKERRVGPTGTDAVTVRMLGRRRS
jgi:SAM-dependent methyltransferase